MSCKRVIYLKTKIIFRPDELCLVPFTEDDHPSHSVLHQETRVLAFLNRLSKLTLVTTSTGVHSILFSFTFRAMIDSHHSHGRELSLLFSDLVEMSSDLTRALRTLDPLLMENIPRLVPLFLTWLKISNDWRKNIPVDDINVSRDEMNEQWSVLTKKDL